MHALTTVTTDPRARGEAIGTRFAAQVRRVAERYTRHFAVLGIAEPRVRELALRSHESLRAWAPELAAESDACADAAGVERWRVAAVGARTEVLAGKDARGECSTVVFGAGHGAAPQTMQTWDWHASLVPDGLLHRYTPRPGHTVALFTEFGAPGKIGVNSAGLGVHFNILFHRSDSDAGGVPVHAIARRVLDEAETLDQAVDLVATARVSASTALTVVTAAGTASLELSPAGMAVVPADADGRLLHTNHFLDAGLAAGDVAPEDTVTAQRLAHLKTVTPAAPALPAAARARALCGDAGADAVVCLRPDPAKPPHEQWGTLLTIGLDLDACALDHTTGTLHEASRHGFDRF
nr:C45 family peptidase [Streptomyces sp. HNM0574]